MIRMKCLYAVFGAAMLWNSAYGAEDDKTSLYYIGANGLLSIRKGAYEFEPVELRQDTARNNMLMAGVALGRRYEFTPNVRLSVGAIFNMGSVIEDTLQTDYDTYVLVKQWLLQVGIDPELQFARANAGAPGLYAFVGGGISYVRFKTGFALFDEPREEAEFRSDANMPAQTEHRWSPHAHAGIGLDIMPRREIGISLRYSLRFSKPVAYEESRELYLENIPYYELHFSHMLQFQILFQFED